jgi:hypothetical protein
LDVSLKTAKDLGHKLACLPDAEEIARLKEESMNAKSLGDESLRLKSELDHCQAQLSQISDARARERSEWTRIAAEVCDMPRCLLLELDMCELDSHFAKFSKWILFLSKRMSKSLQIFGETQNSLLVSKLI